MLSDFTGAEKVYIACGYTDVRKGIDGLAAMVQQEFELDPFTNTLFLFCGRRRDRIKGLYWEGDGFILLYKRLERGVYQWPRNEREVREITPQQYRWLMDGLPPHQNAAKPHLIRGACIWQAPFLCSFDAYQIEYKMSCPPDSFAPLGSPHSNGQKGRAPFGYLRGRTKLWRVTGTLCHAREGRSPPGTWHCLVKQLISSYVL